MFEFILVECIFKSNGSRYSRSILFKTKSIWEYELLKTSWYPRVSRVRQLSRWEQLVPFQGAEVTFSFFGCCFWFPWNFRSLHDRWSPMSISVLLSVKQISSCYHQRQRESIYTNKSQLISFHSIPLINSFAYNDILVCTTCVTYLFINISLW